MLTIKKVSQITGLTEHTLRAWEKRHQAITPQRNASGRRHYSLSELHRIQLLAHLTNEGHPIGQIARLKTTSLEELWSKLHSPSFDEAPAGSTPFAVFTETPPTSTTVERLVDLTLSQLKFYNSKEVINSVHHARLQTDPRSFLLDFMVPLLSRLGSAVAQKSLDISHEHFLSAILRYFISDLLYQLSFSSPSLWKQRSKTTIVFATPEKEYHEFGIQISACLASLMGIKSFYLGANLPIKSLITSARSLGASIVVLGTLPSSKVQAKDRQEYIRKCRKSLDPSIQLWVGGNMQGWNARMKSTNKKHPSLLYFDSFSSFEKAISTACKSP